MTTLLLKARVPVELIEDLTAYHDDEAAKSVLRELMREQIELEIGNQRGTLTQKLEIDSNTSKSIHRFYFINDGQFGPEDFWGLPPNSF